jgi:hypothetical protein
MDLDMRRPIVLFLSLLFIGTIGYHVIESTSFLDSIYMTIITIFTVGFREVTPLSELGQIFTIFIILGGVGSVLYTFSRLAEIVYEGTINKIWRRKRMEKRIQKLKDHYIICGHGRMGNTVRERLEEENLPYVVIDNSEEGLIELKEIDQSLSVCPVQSHGRGSRKENPPDRCQQSGQPIQVEWIEDSPGIDPAHAGGFFGPDHPSERVIPIDGGDHREKGIPDRGKNLGRMRCTPQGQCYRGGGKETRQGDRIQSLPFGGSCAWRYTAGIGR